MQHVHFYWSTNEYSIKALVSKQNTYINTALCDSLILPMVSLLSPGCCTGTYIVCKIIFPNEEDFFLEVITKGYGTTAKTVSKKILALRVKA